MGQRTPPTTFGSPSAVRTVRLAGQVRGQHIPREGGPGVPLLRRSVPAIAHCVQLRARLAGQLLHPRYELSRLARVELGHGRLTPDNHDLPDRDGILNRDLLQTLDQFRDGGVSVRQCWTEVNEEVEL